MRTAGLNFLVFVLWLTVAQYEKCKMHREPHQYSSSKKITVHCTFFSHYISGALNYISPKVQGYFLVPISFADEHMLDLYSSNILNYSLHNLPIVLWFPQAFRTRAHRIWILPWLWIQFLIVPQGVLRNCVHIPYCTFLGFWSTFPLGVSSVTVVAV